MVTGAPHVGDMPLGMSDIADLLDVHVQTGCPTPTDASADQTGGGNPPSCGGSRPATTVQHDRAGLPTA